MITPISFASTYKVNNKNKSAFGKFHTYALNKENENGVCAIFNDSLTIKGGRKRSAYEYFAEQTLIVPDYMDDSVENFCYQNGIHYKKISNNELFNKKELLQRVDAPKEGYRKANVDSKKLMELASRQLNNFSHCKHDYDMYYAQSVDTMIKSGEKIPATTLHIASYSDNQDLRRYVNNFGVENLNEEQVMLDFVQQTDNPDHCVFFALQDLGMDKIPVYVDEKSYEAGKILGLF
ncbi:hypothetical protein IJ670_06575 [bacterium]|nr:hypothetical protein [bacterium]